MTIEKRTIVVTGATGGLGAVLTRQLAARGADLVLLDRDAERLTSLTSDLLLSEERFLTRSVDLLNPAETRQAAEAALARFGHIDALLHLVGGWTGGKTLLEAPAEDLTFMLSQHIWTSFNVVQAFVPHLVANGWGRVVMITSPYAANPAAKGGPYAIGKAGQETLILTLAQELKGTGVTANLLQAKTIDVKHEKVTAPTPQNAGWTTPEEISAAVLYLLSDEAGTINGAKIPLFGG
jgi:NAD(P)-dependent dehydrogenase (short-subunit alcohol dehydrogenase family)